MSWPLVKVHRPQGVVRWFRSTWISLIRIFETKTEKNMFFLNTHPVTSIRNYQLFFFCVCVFLLKKLERFWSSHKFRPTHVCFFRRKEEKLRFVGPFLGAICATLAHRPFAPLPEPEFVFRLEWQIVGQVADLCCWHLFLSNIVVFFVGSWESCQLFFVGSFDFWFWIMKACLLRRVKD